MGKGIKVDNLANFEFWVNIFKPRSKKWQRDNLKRLKQSKSIFETDKKRNDKIKALEFVLD